MVPDQITYLSELTHLNISRNDISHLPEKLGALIKLEVLSVRRNRLTEIPVSIGQLKNLKILDIAGNKLPHLPIELEWEKLKALWISENQQDPIPKLQRVESSPSHFKF